jgi:hypothetical protein
MQPDNALSMPNAAMIEAERENGNAALLSA